MVADEQRAVLGVARVARALVSANGLAELADGALGEISAALGLDVTAMYLPGTGAGTVLRRFATFPKGDPVPVADELQLAPEGLRFLTTSGPLVFRERTGWVIENPFLPPAESWALLPLISEGSFLGAVAGCSSRPIPLALTHVATLSAVADVLSAGVATARLRTELHRTALERERVRLAAELHDGVAQDLALAVRELAFLDTDPGSDLASASRARLREAVNEAHRVIRAGLEDLAAQVPHGGLAAAVEGIAARFRRRGLDVTVSGVTPVTSVDPRAVAVALRVLSEALANVHAHARADRADVAVEATEDMLRVTVTDDGCGFDVTAIPRPGEGHFGVAIMHDRARSAGGSLRIEPGGGRGTIVELTLPNPVGGAVSAGDA